MGRLFAEQAAGMCNRRGKVGQINEMGPSLKASFLGPVFLEGSLTSGGKLVSEVFGRC